MPRKYQDDSEQVIAGLQSKYGLSRDAAVETGIRIGSLERDAQGEVRRKKRRKRGLVNVNEGKQLDKLEGE